ncbi:MAG: hypothetical protein IT542_03965 [Rubellimicrobium sp.]|nr:hypothetical protein [Rubellimicrobium sp.]
MARTAKGKTTTAIPSPSEGPVPPAADPQEVAVPAVPDPLPQPAPEAPQPAPEPSDEAPPAEPAPAPPPLPEAPATPPRAPHGRGMALPVLGGAVAAVIGLGAGWILWGGAQGDGADLARRLGEQELAIAALSERAAVAAPQPDLTPLLGDIAAIRADLVAQTGALGAEVDDLAQRVGTIERAPLGDGTLSETAIASWTADLAALRADLAALAGRMDGLAGDLSRQEQGFRADLDRIESGAQAATGDILRRAALERVLAALDAGTPFAEALVAATPGAVPPPTLGALAETGIPTVALLRDTFPAAARAALAVARDEGLVPAGDGVMGFLRGTIALRSTEPREGDDPDAVLSRAEAALRDNRPDDALAELALLPEVVRAAMGDWLTRAETRHAAFAEAAILAGGTTDPN